MDDSLTIPHIDEDLKRKLEELAKKNNTSIEDVALRYLHKLVDVPGVVFARPDKNDAIERLSGLWNENEATVFQENIAWLRRIDREIWE